MKFAAIVEDAGENFSAYLPDVPGCVAVGDTPEDALKSLSEALAIYLDELRLAGEQLPVRRSVMATEVEPAQVS